jgi:hypothetical protein
MAGGRIRLKSLDDLRRLGAKTLNQLLAGQVEDSRARCIFYGLSVMAQICKDSALEERVETLETKWEEKDDEYQETSQAIGKVLSAAGRAA